MPKPLTRLTEPLVRENGQLRPTTWDEALDRAAEGFRAARAAHGPDALTRVAFGTHNIDSCNRT
jgi:formate dehydrogenase major subunit